jgi:hypothetical protein
MKSINYEKILIFFWICILISINSSYTTALELTNINIFPIFSKSNFFIFANFVRFYIPFVILPILIIIFLFNSSKKIDIFTSVFIIYFCWQLFVFFFSNRKSDSYAIFTQAKTLDYNLFYSEFEEALFTNLNLIFCSLSILIIITIANNLNLKKFNKKIFLTTLGFVGLIAIYFTYHLIDESVKNNTKFIYFSETLVADGTTFYQTNPRITGLSRIILIFYFLSFFLLLKSRKKIILYIILMILIMLIYKMQTRGSFVGILILYIYFFLFYSIKLKKKLIKLLVLVIVPIIIFESYYFSISTYSSTNAKTDNEKTQLLNRKHEENRLIKNESTSGRFDIWKNALLIITEKKIILGYGPQADRFLFLNFRINNLSRNIYYDKHGNLYLYDNNASNSLIYAYLCGGVIGIILLLFIYLLVIAVVTNNIFKKKNLDLQNNLWVNFSTILLIYLAFRSIFENSFSVFGVDYIFLILAYFESRKFSKSTC